MKSPEPTPSAFLITTPPEDVRREKEKARKLRKTQWWQRQAARGRCHYCGQTVPSNELTMDHIVPLIRGGRSNRGNVVPACKSCNTKKKYYVPLEWAEYLESLSKQGAPDRILIRPESEEENDGTV